MRLVVGYCDAMMIDKGNGRFVDELAEFKRED